LHEGVWLQCHCEFHPASLKLPLPRRVTVTLTF
jgi:hypothetical protein